MIRTSCNKSRAAIFFHVIEYQISKKRQDSGVQRTLRPGINNPGGLAVMSYRN